MTKEQLFSLKFKASIFAQLTEGGHLQAYYNDKYGIGKVSKKQTRKDDWRTYYFIDRPEKIYTGGVKELTLDELVEAVKDIPFEVIENEQV